MKKFVSTILIFAMVSTGAATSCFAQTESYQFDADGDQSINVKIDIHAQGGEARAESKASASSGSRFSKIAKIALWIAILVIIKKYVNANMDNMKAMLEDLKEKLSSYRTENTNQEQEEQEFVMGSESEGSKIVSFKSFIENLLSVVKNILWPSREQGTVKANGASVFTEPFEIISN